VSNLPDSTQPGNGLCFYRLAPDFNVWNPSLAEVSEVEVHSVAADLPHPPYKGGTLRGWDFLNIWKPSLLLPMWSVL
jgi:hypothetical protein